MAYRYRLSLELELEVDERGRTISTKLAPAETFNAPASARPGGVIEGQAVINRIINTRGMKYLSLVDARTMALEILDVWREIPELGDMHRLPAIEPVEAQLPSWDPEPGSDRG